MKSKTTGEETFNSIELIHQLYGLISSKKFKKRKPLPVFSLEEAFFITDLIFFKPHGIVFFYLADAIANRTELGRMGMFNGRGYRKYRFINCFLKCWGNSTKAAICAGYSPRSAKQQGYRILKQIQNMQRAERRISNE